MGLRIYVCDGFYIIEINDTKDEEKIKEAIDRALIMRGIKYRPDNKYSIYYTKDKAFCIVDFNNLKLQEDSVEGIVKMFRKKRD